MSGVSDLKRDVISACRILGEQKLVEGFGHVSARLPDSESFLLTPRISLALVEEADAAPDHDSSLTPPQEAPTGPES